MISVLILTRNEEQDLPGCLASVAWSDDIHVLDSLSSDRTVSIAEAAGAHVTQRAFDNWASHQNWALRNVPFKFPWIFYLDADERVTHELRVSLLKAALNPGQTIAFRVQRRDFFLGRWLKHVQTSPFYIRLFRVDKMRYERLVNPLSIADGEVGELDGYLDHYPFSKGISHWLDRHNQYSTLEAQQITVDREASPSKDGRPFSLHAAFFEKDFNQRRFHQKELFYRLPFRPLIKFFLLYVLKRGFLDGNAGLTYSVLQAFYEYLIELKRQEILFHKNNT